MRACHGAVVLGFCAVAVVLAVVAAVGAACVATCVAVVAAIGWPLSLGYTDTGFAYTAISVPINQTLEFPISAVSQPSGFFN